MLSMGNKRVNALWEAGVPSNVSKPAGDAIRADKEAYIYLKYITKSFLAYDFAADLFFTEYFALTITFVFVLFNFAAANHTIFRRRQSRRKCSSAARTPTKLRVLLA
jgi:hypothetical protein